MKSPNDSALSRRDILAMSAGLLTTSFTAQRTTAGDRRCDRSSDDTNALSGCIQTALRALDTNELVQMAIELVDVPSFTGHEEAAARLFQAQMAQRGLVTRLQPL